MTAVATHSRAFAIRFKDLSRWSVNSFFRVKWHWSRDVIAPLSKALRRKILEINNTSINPGDLQLITLHFDGEIEPRDLRGKENFKGKLFHAEPGDVVYSKIDVRNGAIGVIPTTMPKAAVSSEYPVYHVFENIALPGYVKLLFRTNAFRHQINSLISGTSGRKRVQPSDLEHLEVPLPDPSIQQSILGYWQKAQERIESGNRIIATLIKELNERLYSQYRLNCRQDVIGAHFFILDFKDLERWDVKSGRSSAFRIYCQKFRPMGNFIEDATELVRPFEEPEKEWPIYGVNNQEGVFFNTYQKGCNFNAPYKRIRKDWFFHNPTRCNVGSLGIVPDVPEDAITSPEYQVWRLRENDSERLLPGYVALLIQAPFFLELVQFNRVGAVKQRMYYENLCEIRIPFLPESEQRRYSKERARALEEIQKARTNLEQVKKEIEEMILGIRPFPQ